MNERSFNIGRLIAMKTWFKQKLNWIVMGIAAVVTLSFIWTLIPGFSKLPNNVDNMRVAVVDRDN